MDSSRRLRSTILIGAALFLLPSSGRTQDIVLGMSAAFTGPSRGLGIELYRGSMAYLEHVNRAGGVQGRKLAIKAYDDGYNPGPAVENTIRLIEQDKAFLLFNYVGTPTVTRTLPLLKRSEDQSVYLFFPFTGAEPQRQPPYNAFVFNFRASYYQETAGLVDHLLAVGRKRIAVFYQADAYGRTGWDGVRRALGKQGLRMTGEATYRRGTPFDASLQEQVDILRKTGPDAIICVGAYAACAAFIRDVRDAGWDVPVANVSFVGSESMLEQLVSAGKAKGVDYTKRLINSQVVPSYHDLDLPAVREYRALMDKYKPGPPAGLAEKDYPVQQYCFVSFEGFLNAKLLVAVLRRLEGNLERKRLPQAARAIDKLDLGIGEPISFHPDRKLEIERVYFTTVSEGRFVTLSDWSRWQP